VVCGAFLATLRSTVPLYLANEVRLNDAQLANRRINTFYKIAFVIAYMP
jgi:hypothetical protein